MVIRHRQRVSIQDVARACGVAPSTVSNALSGKAHVREETRNRVVEIAQQMGYRPSAIARSLRMQRTWSIGLLIADITNPFFPEVVRGVEDVVAAEQCNLILCNTDYQPEKQARYLQVLLDKQVDGLILASQSSDSQDVVQLHNDGVPFVLVNRRHHLVTADYVGLDNQKSIALVLDHLVALGHRHFAYVAGPPDSAAAEERYESFLMALKDRDLPLEPTMVMDGDYSMAAGHRAALKLAGLPTPPTAVICTNDLMALGAIDGFMEQGWRVPEDMSVVGFDDISMSSLRSIGLTTIHQPKREMGAAAAKLLLKRIKARRPPPTQEANLEPELIVRRTTAPPRAAGFSVPAISVALGRTTDVISTLKKGAHIEGEADYSR